MPRLQGIYENEKVVSYLVKRGLLAQYKKAKEYLLAGEILKVRFKERNPKGCGLYYFRINRQFRALGVFEENGNLIIFDVDNHQ